jgi:hypothetical protein
MPRPKTKIEVYEGVPPAIDVEDSHIGGKMVVCAPVEEIVSTLALRKASELFLLKHPQDVEKVRERLTKSNKGDCKTLTFVILWNFFYEVIVHPEVSIGEGTFGQKQLCAFLTLWPDFTIEYLATLRAAFVKSKTRPTASQTSIAVLRGRKEIKDSFGKTSSFEAATDLEICSYWKISPSDYKQAKRKLKEADSAFFDLGKLK